MTDLISPQQKPSVFWKPPPDIKECGAGLQRAWREQFQSPPSQPLVGRALGP